jgi:hypothetical protein
MARSPAGATCSAPLRSSPLPHPRAGFAPTFYLCPTTPTTPRTLDAPDHPATVSIREDLLVDLGRQSVATHIFGSDRADQLAEQLPATAAEDTARRGTGSHPIAQAVAD